MSTIELTREGAVAVLKLNRPDKYNAVDRAMHKEFAGALRELQRDGDVRAVVLAAEGKAFCSGQDLREFEQAPDDFRIDTHVRTTFNRVALGLRELPKPVIAAVNGVAAGAGASLALCADLRICGESALFMQAFMKIGLVPDTGSTWLLPHLVGISRALELAWSARPVDAREALAIGLCNEVVADDVLLQTAVERAQQLAQMPTAAIGMTKRAMYRALTTDFADALEYEAQLQQVAGATADHSEGLLAFREKREPVFTGH